MWIIKLWPENSSPALQLFHLCFGAGCLVAPFIAEPFLSSTPNEHGSLAPNHTLSALEYGTEHALNVSNDIELEESQIKYAFGIAFIFHVFLVASMVVLYIIDNANFKPQKDNGAEVVPADENAKQVRFSRVMLSLLGVYICVYVSLECTCSQMLTAYGVKSSLHLSKSSASRLAAVYFFCFAAFRGVAAVIAMKASAFQMMVGSHVIIVVSATILLIFGSSSETALWVCFALMGIGQAPIYGAAVAWVVGYINMTNTMMSLIMVASGTGSLSPALLVGQFLESTPASFLYVCFLGVVTLVVVFLTMFLYARRHAIPNSRG